MSGLRIVRFAGRTMRRRLMVIGIVGAALAAFGVVASQPARSASTPPSVTVSAAQPVYLVQPGGTAHPGLTLTTASGQPLDRAVTVTYQTGGTLTVGSQSLPSTAAPGTDYTPASGSVTFPAGTASGTTKTFSVSTRPNRRPAEAKTINTVLSTSDSAANVTGDPPTVVIDAHGLPYLNPSLPIRRRVADLLSRMSLAEKIGQMTQADKSMFTDSSTTSANSIDNLRAWNLGSVLSGGGDTPTPNTPTAWANMIDSFEAQSMATPLQIPLIYGLDTVHGDNDMAGATIFPHNIGMGATRDPGLTFQEGQVTGAETRTTGPQWGFAPCVCVARDDRWGRTYESFGEDPALVSRMETEISGFQGTHPQGTTSGQSSLNSNDHILSTAKHYAGDGGTKYGTGDGGSLGSPPQYPIDQGVDIMSSSTFRRLHVSPYVTAVQQQQVGSIMPSYSSVQLDGASCPTKMSASKYWLTNVLKQQIGFKGFLISDYNAVNEIGDARSCPLPNPLPAGVPDGAYGYQIEVSANAGMDMFMVPNTYQELETDLVTLVHNGVVPMSRVNDAVARILTQKFELGLFEHPFTNRSKIGQVGDAAHRAVAARAAAESQVLLKNAHHVLPLSPRQHVYVAGSNADNLGNQTGGWMLQWQGQPGPLPIPGTTILQGIRARDPNVTYSPTASAPTSGSNVGVVVVGEHAYAEGPGDVGGPSWAQNGPITSLNLTPADHQAVDTVCHAMPCVVMVVSGRPMTITDQVPEIDGLVASWLPGTEGEGVADTLFGKVPFTGQLPQSWPRTLSQEPINIGDPNYNPLFPFGWGLQTTTARHDAAAATGTMTGNRRLRAAQARMATLSRSGSDWKANGSARRSAAVLSAVRQAAQRMSGASLRQQEAVVGVARDIAQASVVAAGGPDARTSPLLARADHALLAGHPARAVALLTQAAG